MNGDLAERVAIRAAAPRRGRRATAALLALALSPVLAACSGGAAPTPAGVPASPTGAPPGSTLVDGLRTPPGTLLLGGVFPRPRGAAAVMLVTGDPVGAFRDLAGQAQQRGYDLRPHGAEQSCWVSMDPDRWWSRPGEYDSWSPPASGITGLGCGMAGWTGASGGQGRYVSLRLLAGVADRPYLAHLGLTYAVADAAEVYPVPPAGGFEPPPPASPFEPPPLTRVPGPGAELGLPFITEPALRVAAGTAPLAPAFPADCGAGGVVAVLAVTGEIASVVEEYAAQFARAGLRQQERPALPAGSGEAVYLSATTAGGGDATITAMIVNDHGYALVERCLD